MVVGGSRTGTPGGRTGRGQVAADWFAAAPRSREDSRLKCNQRAGGRLNGCVTSFVGTSVRRNVGSQERRFAGPSVRRNDGSWRWLSPGSSAAVDNVQCKTSPSHQSPILLSIKQARLLCVSREFTKQRHDYHCQLSRLHECHSLMQLNKVKFTAVKRSSYLCMYSCDDTDCRDSRRVRFDVDV